MATTYTPEDKGIIESLLYLKEKGLIKNQPSIHFESVKEAETSAKEDIVAIIKEKLNTMKQDLSYVQKKGQNRKLDGIRLLEVPLKIKVWLSTTSRKDLENIFSILESVEKEIAPIKKIEEEKELEKERIA